MKDKKVTKDNVNIKNKNTNTYLIASVSCIVLLLTLCYFGINTGVKVTYSAGETYTCPSGFSGATAANNGWCYNSNIDQYTCEEEYYYTWENGSCKVKATNVTCSKGYYYAGSGSCVTCRAGYYCPGTSTYPSNTQTIGIVQCPGGSTSTSGAKSESDCEATITFDANGWEEGSTSINKKIGENISLVTVSRDGYEFLGWYDAKVGGNKIGVSGDKYTVQGNATLYAHWKLEDDAPVEEQCWYCSGGSYYKW